MNLQKAQFIVGVGNLAKAFKDLDDLLSIADQELIRSDEYPFDKSFDEVAADVRAWSDNETEIFVYDSQKPPFDWRKQNKMYAEFQSYYCIVKVEFAYENYNIINPFKDVGCIQDVDPAVYYGEAFFESDWNKNQYDLTADQMVTWLIEMQVSHFSGCISIDDINHIFRYGVVGYDKLNNEELHQAVYDMLGIE